MIGLVAGQHTYVVDAGLLQLVASGFCIDARIEKSRKLALVARRAVIVIICHSSWLCGSYASRTGGGFGNSDYLGHVDKVASQIS